MTEIDSESVAQRNNRNLADLLQELRVAGLGVQVLFGFLLSLPFTNRFALLGASQRNLYQASLILAACSIALLVAPVAYHRWAFRMHEKSRILKVSNVLALGGLATVALAISSSLFLVLSFVATPLTVSILVSVSVAAFAFLWFALPLVGRRNPPEGEKPETL